MLKLLLAGSLMVSLVAPVAGYAQRPAPPPRHSRLLDEDIPLSPGGWLAVGAVVVAGVVFAETLLPDEITSLAIGAAGGYLAYIWFNGERLVVTTE